MIFSSLPFFIFFAVVMAFLALVKSNPVKKGFLLVASYFFYAYWDYRFTLLMFGMSLANYIFGRRLEASQDERLRRTWLTGSVIFNLMVLGIFKYFDFFIESANALLAGVGLHLGTLRIILPVGISFITFEVMSYTIDIYRREGKSADSFFDLAMLVAFFPHLVAGPILKPRQFLPQLKQEIRITQDNLIHGGQLFLVGLVKKVLVADRLAPFVDLIFQHPAAFNSATIWLAVLAYAMQIYCDFSGYSDMGIGVAKCMGFEIPPNFNSPYTSRNIATFWRRWHISLSSWLRDYLYVSLGGNRKGRVRTYMNLMTVMLLGGLWHGASWNFVVWGGLHGIALAIHRLISDLSDKERAKPKGNVLLVFLSWLTTFVFVCTAWVFFRSHSFATSWVFVRKMYFVGDCSGVMWLATALLIALPIYVLAEFAITRLLKGEVLPLHRFVGLFVLFFVILGALFLAPENPVPFIYFQF